MPKTRAHNDANHQTGDGVPLVEKCCQQIKRMLLVDELVAGQKLRYQDIATKLGVSQTPVIMALTRLENEHLVRSEANRGFFVPELDLEEARELYELRGIIECFLIKQTVAIITNKQLNQLKKLMKEHQGFRGESYTRERLWCDARIHLALASFSEHQVGITFLGQVFDRLFLRYRPDRLSAQRMLESEEQHNQLLEALAARDGNKAAKLLGVHIQKGSQHILEGLRRQAELRKAMAPWGVQSPLPGDHTP